VYTDFLRWERFSSLRTSGLPVHLAAYMQAVPRVAPPRRRLELRTDFILERKFTAASGLANPNL
jgi:hypothetical protein